MIRNKIIRWSSLAVVISLATWMTIQDFRTFFVEDKGIEYYQNNPIMILVCLAIGIIVGLAAHFIVEWKNKRKEKAGVIPEINGA